MRFLALMDEYGDEMCYLGNYTRQPMPEFESTLDDWVRVDFGQYFGKDPIIVMGYWVLENEHDRMRRGQYVFINKTINQYEKLAIHFRNPEKPVE